MKIQVPSISQYDISESGRLSILVDCQFGPEQLVRNPFLLQERESPKSAQAMDFVSKVGGKSQFHGTLTLGKEYLLIFASDEGKLVRMKIPAELDSSRKDRRGGWMGRIQSVLGGASCYIKYEGSQSLETPCICTHHDSVDIWLPGAPSLKMRARKAQVSVLSEQDRESGVNSFSVKNFNTVLHEMADGVSLWDIVQNDAVGERVSVNTEISKFPRKDFKYPWFWMSSDLFVVKARIYWSENGYLALKIVKKGIE